MGVAGEGINETESIKFEEVTFGKVVEFKKYLGQERMDSMKSWAGIEEGKAGKECLLCDAECESVSHVLWDCPAYASIRSAFMLELRRELGDRFERFQSLDSFAK